MWKIVQRTKVIEAVVLGVYIDLESSSFCPHLLSSKDEGRKTSQLPQQSTMFHSQG